jgi:hypothetical protein
MDRTLSQEVHQLLAQERTRKRRNLSCRLRRRPRETESRAFTWTRQQHFLIAPAQNSRNAAFSHARRTFTHFQYHRGSGGIRWAARLRDGVRRAAPPTSALFKLRGPRLARTGLSGLPRSMVISRTRRSRNVSNSTGDFLSMVRGGSSGT